MEMRALKKQPLGNVLAFEKPSIFFIECIDNLEFMRTLKNDSMHLIVTSPPYNLGKTR
jgi:adenine-specific DNA-methyltransferase